MANSVDRCCVACRRMIPSDNDEELIALVKIATKFIKKGGNMVAKIQDGVLDTLCSDCTPKFKALIAAQKEKGYKI